MDRQIEMGTVLEFRFRSGVLHWTAGEMTGRDSPKDYLEHACAWDLFFFTYHSRVQDFLRANHADDEAHELYKYRAFAEVGYLETFVLVPKAALADRAGFPAIDRRPEVMVGRFPSLTIHFGVRKTRRRTYVFVEPVPRARAVNAARGGRTRRASGRTPGAARRPAP
jgi:hypothetical protein